MVTTPTEVRGEIGMERDGMRVDNAGGESEETKWDVCIGPSEVLI